MNCQWFETGVETPVSNGAQVFAAGILIGSD